MVGSHELATPAGVLSFLRRSRRCFPLGSHQVFSGPTKRTFTEDVVYIRHYTSTYLSISITPLASFFEGIDF